MKTFAFTILAFLMVTSCLGQKKIPLSFEDGTEIELTVVDSNPNNHPKTLISLDFLDFRINNAATGPFSLEPGVDLYDMNNENSIFARAFYTPLGFKLLEDLDNGRYHFNRLEFEAGYRYFLNSKLSTKKNAKITVGTGYNKIYRIKTDWPKASVSSLRGGLYYNQRATNERTPEFSTYTDEDGIVHNLLQTIEGTRTISLFAGISLQRKLKINFKTEDLGQVDAFELREIYADFLFSPLNSAFGTEKYFDSDSSEFVFINEGKIKEENFGADLALKSLGFRVGIQKKTAPIGNSKIGKNIGTEIALRPGLTGYGFEWTFIKFGLLFY